MLSLFRRWNRRRLLRQPLAASRRELLHQHVAAYPRLSRPLQQRLEQTVAVMLAELHWEGCAGLQVTDAMRTRIAGHAAVMLLGAQDYYFDTVTTILIFPHEIQRDGDSDETLNAGEAWDNGGIVLAWPEVMAIGQHPGENVVIHEFAHHLDGLDGEMAGSIPFNHPADQTRWDQVAAREYEQLIDDVEHGRPTVLDPYGTTDRAEFFAVCSECFFEQPHDLQQAHGELFELLLRFYQCDPRLWQ
jgi:Mlc titration factor MtfA (ptsG expression regulator)